MPPPELLDRSTPDSVASLVLGGSPPRPPIPRSPGPLAEEASLRARLGEARRRGDREAEAHAAEALARLLASERRNLAEAARLAERALELGTGSPASRLELAGELSTWWTALGEPARAAEALAPLCAPEGGAELSAEARRRACVRLATLRARAGNAGGAALALEAAVASGAEEGEPSRRELSARATALELLGALSGWAPEAVPPARAEAAFLRAAKLREGAGERELAFEDRLRAFEVHPGGEDAASALASALAERGRAAAVDEVRRLHAEALEGPGSEARRAALHAARMVSALFAGDLPRAVSALFDAGLEAQVEAQLEAGVAERTEAAARVDQVLSMAGLHELVALRLELRAEDLRGPERARVCAELARLSAGPLAGPERALEAWVEAVAADPSDASSLGALREHAALVADGWPLVAALAQAALAPDQDEASRRAALRELAVFAETRLGDGALAHFAWERLAALEGAAEGAEAAAAAARLFPKRRQHEEALAGAERLLAGVSSGGARREALARLASLLRSRPDLEATRLSELAELAELSPEERSPRVALERASRRAGNFSALERVLELRAGDPRLPSPSRLRAALARAKLVRRRAGDEAALEVLRPHLEATPGHRAATSFVLLLAGRLGRVAERTEALAHLAAQAPSPIRAALLSAASAARLRAGDAPGARRLAEEAALADPGQPRALSGLAAAIAAERDGHPGDDGERTASVLERAMGVVVPRGILCRALARAFEAGGEPRLALAWTQRWLALHPGRPEAMAELLRRARACEDAERLGDALAWLVAQPQPLGALAEPLARALETLLALDRERGLSALRRITDAGIAVAPALHATLLELADAAEDTALALAMVERAALSPRSGAASASTWLEIAGRRVRFGDLAGAATHLARAARAGAEPEALEAGLTEVERAGGPALGGDARLALAEARVAASRRPGREAEAALALRALGAARWDLAGDLEGASEALFEAALGEPDPGAAYARDLAEIVGPERASRLLVLRAEGSEADEGGRRTSARLLALAAELALSAGLPAEALSAACGAIERDPSRADAIALVERSAHAPGGAEALDRAYARLAEAALGRYGRRAAHYRASRQFERRGDLERAFRHAVASFEAVPTEGTGFVLLARLAERVADPLEGVRALEAVAAASPPAERVLWLKRAGALAGAGDEGLRTRFELLLRALLVSPETSLIGDLGAAALALLDRGEDRDVLLLRVDRAARKVLEDLDGPEGARAALALARLASTLGDAELAFEAVLRAARADGDVEEFGSLELFAASLGASSAAGAFLEALGAHAKRPYASLGPALLRLGARVAGAAGDGARAAALLVEAARRAPDDDALVHEADVAAREFGDENLRRALGDALPVARRLEALLALADGFEREGEDARAVVALERALAWGELGEPERERLVGRARQLLGIAGRASEAEALLARELARPELPEPARLRWAADLVGLLAARGEAAALLEVAVDTAARVPLSAEILGEARKAAAALGDEAALVPVLERMAEHAEDPDDKLAWLRELAALEEALGREGAAERAAVAELDPSDPEFLEALERDAASKGDYARAAELLARRVELSPPEARRALRLRRAALLEQRLGRLDEAAEELGALLAEHDDPGAKRFLADLHERLGEPLVAAPLWRELALAAGTDEERSACEERAAAALLAGGDLDGARSAVEQAEVLGAREATRILRLEIARRSGDPAELFSALEALASCGSLAPEQQAAHLLEAARVAWSIRKVSAALDCARRACALTPDAPAAIVEHRRFAYLVGGTGTPRDAQGAVEELLAASADLPRDLAEVHAFLLAEQLDVIQGKNAGMRELTRRHAELGALPLIALGMAERLVRSRSYAAALPLFERALAGDLHGMRSRGRVALAAADAAARSGDRASAERLLDLASAEPDARDLAARRRLELAAEGPEPGRAKEALEALAARSEGPMRARLLVQLALLLAATEPDAASKVLEQAAAIPGAEVTLRSRLADARAKLEKARAAAEAMADPLKALALETSRALERPTNPEALLALSRAAERAGDSALARAAAHVLGAADPSRSASPPPPLGELAAPAEAVRAALFGDLVSPSNEALALALSAGVLHHELEDYDLGGISPCSRGEGGEAERLFSELVRRLGAPGVRLFRPRAEGPLEARILLLSPPAVSLAGDAENSPELRYLLGASLAGALPEHAAVHAQPEETVTALLEGLTLAFGPPRPPEAPASPAAARFAEIARARVEGEAAERLRRLCADPTRLSYAAARDTTLAAMRRAGLFAAGDLRVAARIVAAEDGLGPGALLALEALGDLEAACAADPAVAELVRFALRPGFAAVRFGRREAAGS